MLIAFGVPADELQMDGLLADMQQDLLDLGGELSIPGYTLLKPERVAALDEWLAAGQRQAAAAAGIHPARRHALRGAGTRVPHRVPSRRTIGRRAGAGQAISNTVRQYLNRLSDLLFVMARVLNRSSGGAEHQWDRAR